MPNEIVKNFVSIAGWFLSIVLAYKNYRLKKEQYLFDYIPLMKVSFWKTLNKTSIHIYNCSKNNICVLYIDELLINRLMLRRRLRKKIIVNTIIPSKESYIQEIDKDLLIDPQFNQGEYKIKLLIVYQFNARRKKTYSC